MKVSIIIPTYNSASYLDRALASAIDQLKAHVEIIIVDNNSVDETPAVMKRLRAAYPDLVRLAFEPVQGSAAARNHGVRIAEGEWIQFLDSDDILLPGKLTRQLALAGPETDWVIGAFRQRDLSGKELVSDVRERDPWKGLVHNGGVGHTNSNLIRRIKYLEVGGQNEALPNGVDTDLYFRLLCAGARVVYDDVPGSIHIDREGYRLSTLKSKVSRLRSVELKGRVNAYLEEAQPAYFSEHGSFFRAALLHAIRILATENLGDATEAMKVHFPNGVSERELASGIVPAFARYYYLFGFRNVEALRIICARLLPRELKRQIKGI